MPEGKLAFYRISSRTLYGWKDLVIPAVFEELKSERDVMDYNYLCIGAMRDNEPAGALISHMEQETGDLQIISIYVRPSLRRAGIGGTLIKKLMDAAAAAYIWDEFEYGRNICIKTVFALPEDLRITYDAFLKKCGFSEFYMLSEEKADARAVWAASAELHLFRPKMKLPE